MVIGGADLGTVATGSNTHYVLVECEQGDPFSEELLRIANGGTPVILVGKATVVQDWVDQNTSNGASHMCNFSTNSTFYLGSQEEPIVVVVFEASFRVSHKGGGGGRLHIWVVLWLLRFCSEDWRASFSAAG